MKSWFFSKSFGHAISAYLEGESAPDLSYKKDEVVDEFIPYLVQAAKDKYFTVNKWKKNACSRVTVVVQVTKNINGYFFI